MVINSEKVFVEDLVTTIESYQNSKGKEKEDLAEKLLYTAEEVINSKEIRAQIDKKLLGLLQTIADQLTSALDEGDEYPDLSGIQTELATV